MKLVIEPISAEAFAPYGTVVRAPADLGRIPFLDALKNTRPNARATLSASRALPKTLPLTGTVMERHRFSSQTFFPLDVARYVVVVAPHGAAGLPDMHARPRLHGAGRHRDHLCGRFLASSDDRARPAGLLFGADVARRHGGGHRNRYA